MGSLVQGGSLGSTAYRYGMHRSAFLAGACALFATPTAAARADEAANFSLSRADMAEIVQTENHTHVARVWKPASALPPGSPLALPRRRTSDDGDSAVVYINVDHLELMTPRSSHPADEDPIVAAVIAGTLDLKLATPGWKNLAAELERIQPEARYQTITELGKLLVSAYGVRTVTGISDAEFASEAFPFAVVRNMTPGVPGVNADEPPPGSTMPKDAQLIAYVGRTDTRYPGVPVIWGDSKHAPPNFTQSPQFLDLYMRAYTLATADMEPPGSPEKRAYDEAHAADGRAGTGIYAARYAFAAPYLPRVRALVSH
ncbi:MAG TPA: hypothetical protein VII52_12185 [Gemmatimonadaceae bacterium]